MPQRFGEEITEEDAYNTAREALTYMTDEQLATMPESIAWSDIHKRALADEIAERKRTREAQAEREERAEESER